MYEKKTKIVYEKKLCYRKTDLLCAYILLKTSTGWKKKPPATQVYSECSYMYVNDYYLYYNYDDDDDVCTCTDVYGRLSRRRQ